MTFLDPIWLLLLPALALLGWRLPHLRLHDPLRAACLLLLVLALANPAWRRTVRGIDLWLLVDRSASAADSVEPRLSEWESLVRRAAGRHDQLFVIDYATEPVLRETQQGGIPEIGRQRTRTGLAIEHALARLRPGRAARLLLFTDGFSTEPVADLAPKIAAAGVPLDHRFATPPAAGDFTVRRVRAPAGVQPREAFLLEIEVGGNREGTVPIELLRNDTVVHRGEVEVRAGRGLLRLTDRIAAGGAYRYEARIQPSEDAFAGNNRNAAWVTVASGRRVLLITAFADDPLIPALESQGFEVALSVGGAGLQVGGLAGARAVILNNVPAHQLPQEFLPALAFAVRHQGTGLLMCGGRQSFGSGGYFGSKIDDLLPVSMELRREHRKLATAMAIVMDRSGSMAAGVPGGGTKMDLANRGAARAVELLGDLDAVTVFAVDSTAHTVVPLTQIGPNRNGIIDRARRITSGGGGIFVYEGLSKAWAELKKSEGGQRHVILFSDAADSEEPGAYRELLAEMTAANTTVTVLALGSIGDPDAALLRDIADLGKGRIYFNTDAATLTELFAQETVAVARSAFLTDPARMAGLPAWGELSTGPLAWPQQIEAYNLSYLKPGASAAAATTDAEPAPLVAFWTRGAGRVAAIGFPIAGPHSTATRAWPALGDLLQTVSRWVAAPDLPPGIGLRTRLDGTRLAIDLFHEASWEPRFAKQAPRLVTATGESEPAEQTWERMAPGHYQARIDLGEAGTLRGAVQLESASFPFGPIAIGEEAEWKFDPARPAELAALSAASGGRELLNLEEAWRRPPASQPVPLRGLLTALLCIALPIEIFRTRWSGGRTQTRSA